jgi:uncharacterized protein (UPF0128 family)
MQTCMKPEKQTLTGLSIALKSIDLIHILNSSCLVPKETEFPLSPKKIYSFEFLGHTIEGLKEYFFHVQIEKRK